MIIKIGKLAETINRFGIELGLWANAADETTKKQRELDGQIAVSEGRMRQLNQRLIEASQHGDEYTDRKSVV